MFNRGMHRIQRTLTEAKVTRDAEARHRAATLRALEERLRPVDPIAHERTYAALARVTARLAGDVSYSRQRAAADFATAWTSSTP